ncbi:MAG: activase [Geminicoccaceae bacterium]|nr:MAG: activase [Geminicoccaceae bacterium]
MTRLVGVDVGSTTVKAVLVADGAVRWQDYQRHGTRQAEKVLSFLERMEAEAGLVAGRDRIFLTGSGAGPLAPLLGAKMVQEVVAVAAAVERLHPDVRFVSEIGGEDMKTVFFTEAGARRGKQVYMQAACSGGTGTFVERIAKKLGVTPAQLAEAAYADVSRHEISAKCGIFAEADANSLVKAGVPVEEIIASLFEAVVTQNLATLTKGNTPLPTVLLLGGPNRFFKGLREAWQAHLARLWEQRSITLPAGAMVDDLVQVPPAALYYGALGCVEIARTEPSEVGGYSGLERLHWWIDVGQHEAKARAGAKGLAGDAEELERFLRAYAAPPAPSSLDPEPEATVPPGPRTREPVVIGCDFGSTTAKAVALSAERRLLGSWYVPSKGNPIEDAKLLFGRLREAGFEEVAGLALTGYGKDLLRDVLGADLTVVETVAHARAALELYPDVDVICDVGGTDVKIMILRQGTVADFRLNSQCSSGNGAFLQGVAERYAVPLEDYAAHAFRAQAMPQLAMGCGVFLQSDIVNQQRNGWSADEIMAALASVLPLNVWVYAGQLRNLQAAGRHFVLQGGTHRNLAVVKAQVDFIERRVPDARIVIHPHAGEAGAIGAALAADEARQSGVASRFRGFAAIEALHYRSTTSALTRCSWCTVQCRRTFIDVAVEGGPGRRWSKVKLAEGWERVISGNSCPKGLIEDKDELRVVKSRYEETKRAHPNIGELVRAAAFRAVR